MENVRICKKCGSTINTSKGSDWTCPMCGYTKWGIIAGYGIFSLLCLGTAIFLSPGIANSFLRFLVRWGTGIVGAIVLLATVIWIVQALRTPKGAAVPQPVPWTKVPMSPPEPVLKFPPEIFMKEEQVTHAFPNGNIYIGGWKEDKMSGFGTLSDPNGYFQYVGNWKDGKLDGQGSKTTTGMKYWGEWKAGQYHGHGNITDKLAHLSFVGEFKEGKMDGQGTMTYDDGRVLSGIWGNDKLLP